MQKRKDIIIVGGGAAGFFAAINIAEKQPELSIAILERGKEGLQKVKISGGGRCNVTHAEFIPSELILNYPRGEKELLGPFHTFMTGDTIAWFEERGVQLKIEDDGRMFPVSNSSQTIIDCFLNEAKKHNVEVLYNHSVKSINARENDFLIDTSQGIIECDKLVVATGSNPKMWSVLEDLGHTIVKPVPSLFTFDIKDKRIKDVPGVVAKDVVVKVLGTNLVSEGPLLITHVGMSAPAILKLSAFGAVDLAKLNYNFEIEINFIRQEFEDCLEILKDFKQDLAKKTVLNSAQFDLPKRLWKQLVVASNINETERWADINKQQLENLSHQLTQAIFQVTGKSTFKEEFVTAGGVDLKEVNFKTFESKRIPNLYFAGEVINVDAVTGGFNFQNAWTGAYIVSTAIGCL
ncbi:NAD(P)/FAD-dependent oxidoreductase [Winogradskyella echinorum]|uniref:NAD(P)/FAD-dependent oxidoreductase n=1 Tax=Winogradskyella echinorum TaxID=538189 RepID=A0ABR6XXR5_9FLAO|nr:NAD(P)/FAD-dependent oxidoreductase [Winogradskyella echinorum]MBC3845319.1 NAD(P)/FAD-dependent oxidoreductase [Winogradskyella echinorum]MBC5749667.1 NAD(P)/FAD-dependent oxidoreductase [Winogradskyella echinorum]